MLKARAASNKQMSPGADPLQTTGTAPDDMRDDGIRWTDGSHRRPIPCAAPPDVIPGAAMPVMVARLHGRNGMPVRGASGAVRNRAMVWTGG
jgi:hypothetical protein